MKIRYYGHIGERSGYGVAARAMCRALIAAGIELEIRPIERRVELAIVDDVGDSILLAKHLTAPADLDPTVDVVIVHTMPMDCAKVLTIATRDEGVAPETPAIAYTTWEATSVAPAAIRTELTVFDQLWTPSSFSANGFATSWNRELKVPTAGDRNDTPILVMPHAYDASREYVRERPLTTPYRFVYAGAWTSRKNPAGVIRAFAHANLPRDEAELWIQSTGTPRETFVIALHQTGCVDDQLARIRFFNEPLSAMTMRETYQNADCFVTASRGEAWNLPAFEAMLARIHVIAPTPAGSDEFLVGTTADLFEDGMVVPAAVDVRLLGKEGETYSIQTIGAQGLSARSQWWEPDLTELASLMRRAFENKTRGLAVTYDPAARFSYEAIGKLALQHMEHL